MENLTEDKNVISADLWRIWEAKDRRHDKAIARRVTAISAFLVLLVAGGVYYFFGAR